MREAFAETASDALCTKETTEQVISQMVREANRHYSEIMARLTLPQKELLYAIAKEHWASLKSASSVQSSTKKLQEFGLVSFDSGNYYIADQLMRLWLIT